MRVSSAPCEAGKKTVMQEVFVNFAVLENSRNSIQAKDFVRRIPNLILSDLSPLRYIELLSRGLVCDVFKVDCVFVRKL